MRLKTFTAKTMTEAMALVKKAMGEDAVIMMTRQDAASGMVTVTAAVDEDFLPTPAANQGKDTAAPAFASAEACPSFPALSEEDPLDVISDALDWHHVPRKLAAKILRTCELDSTACAPEILTAALSSCFTCAPCVLQTGEVMALVGLPGAGKTVTTAKLATRAHLAKTPLHVITTDHSKAGGVEQLEALLRVLGLITHSAHDAISLKTLLNLTKAQGAVLIDTPGINPYDAVERAELHTLLQQDTPPKVVLVLAAGMNADDALEQAMAFQAFLPLAGVMVPKLDLSRRLGAALAVAGHLKLPLLEAGTGAAIADALSPFSPAMLSARLLRTATDTQPFAKQFSLSSSVL
jgi:flagellar biosynthesis protein FlhF